MLIKVVNNRGGDVAVLLITVVLLLLVVVRVKVRVGV